MRDKRPLVIGIAAAVLIGVLCGAFALGVFRSDAERATDAVTELMESYVVPVADEDGKEPEDAAWPAADYGDAATMEALQKYGVNADEWHRHCFGNLVLLVHAGGGGRLRAGRKGGAVHQPRPARLRSPRRQRVPGHHHD